VDGSQRAWDLFVKARYLDRKRPGRALIQASGTPITNTLGEMYTLLRFQAPEALRERGVHEFDAWASAFGDTSTELELQPSGAYKPVTRFAAFINVADLMMMFRSVADVVQKTDLRDLLTLPHIRTGQRQLITAEASPAFKDYQQHLAQRIQAIEARKGKVQKGDDILLSVITDGRHAAIDMRLVSYRSEDEPANKLNKLIDNVHRIWAETAAQNYLRPDSTPYPIPGAGQMIFSDLGTISVETTRGFSAYRWIRQQLIARGVPAGQIAFMQLYKRSADKQRLFADFRAGRVRILIGSSDTMGTGVNVQQRLKAMHHLDVPWLPSQIEQREGRIERQGNQHDEIYIFAYATLGSMDATMWQNNERKARFIEAALSGDRSIRRIEDVGSQANQFAMAKAIASGDSRLMRKAGLESEIARLQRRRAAYVDDQHAIRRQIRDARYDQTRAEGRIEAITTDLGRRQSTRGDLFAIEIERRTITERKPAGASLLTKIRIAVRERIVRCWTIGRIGGFDLTCDIRPGQRDERVQPELFFWSGRIFPSRSTLLAKRRQSELSPGWSTPSTAWRGSWTSSVDASPMRKYDWLASNRAWTRHSTCRVSWMASLSSLPRSRQTWPAPRTSSTAPARRQLQFEYRGYGLVGPAVRVAGRWERPRKSPAGWGQRGRRAHCCRTRILDRSFKETSTPLGQSLKGTCRGSRLPVSQWPCPA
jgi:hypothetical protein